MRRQHPARSVPQSDGDSGQVGVRCTGKQLRLFRGELQQHLVGEVLTIEARAIELHRRISGGARRSRRFNSRSSSRSGISCAAGFWTLKRAEARAPSPYCTSLNKTKFSVYNVDNPPNRRCKKMKKLRQIKPTTATQSQPENPLDFPTAKVARH